MNVQLLKALFFQGLGRCFIENQGAFMLAPELLFVSGPLVFLNQWTQFFTGGNILYQHGHFCKSALCCFQCGGSFGAGGGDLGHPAFQIRVTINFMLRQKVQRPGSLFQIVEFCPLLIPCGLLGLNAVLQINPQRNFAVFFGLPLHEPPFDALGDGFLGVDFTQRFAAGEPPLSGRTERHILAPFDLIALLLQEPQKIVKILGLRDGCIYGGFQFCLPAHALAVCVPLGIAFTPVLTGDQHRQAVFLAQTVAGAPDVGIALAIGNILSLVHHVHGAKDDVVVDVPFVNVCGQHIRVFALQDFICKLPADLVGLLRRGFSRRKRLYQVMGQIVAFLHGL